jgi:hypothetical protein
MAEGGSAAAQPMGLSVGANQPWGSVAGKAVDTWDTCPHCNCKDGHYSFCPTQLRLREDKVAYDMETERMKKAIINIIDGNTCPTCKEGVCQCGPDVDESTEEFRSVFVKPEYSDLFEVLRDALEEAQEGKGAVRHGNGMSFTDQPALTITRAVGLGFPLGQAMKKIQESQRMDTDAAKRELLGAINYLAAAVLFLDE